MQCGASQRRITTEMFSGVEVEELGESRPMKADE
jgi:hypothetical protein